MPTKLFKTGVGKATTSWLFYFCFWLVEWAELGNVKSELPVRADMVLSRYAVKSYANVVLKVCRLYQSYVNRRFKAAVCVVVWFYCRRPLIPVRFGLRLTVSQEASSSDGFLELCLSPDTVCLQSGFWSGWCRYLRLLTLARPFSAGKTMMEKKTQTPTASTEPPTEFTSTAVLPYVKGFSEQLRRCLQQLGIHAVFKSETTLRSQLVRPKDAVDPA